MSLKYGTPVRRFAPSSAYMPPFMRVNPVVDWTYGMVTPRPFFFFITLQPRVE